MGKQYGQSGIFS